MNNVFHFDVNSDFSKKVCSFGLLFAQMGFVLIIKVINTIAEAYPKPCKTSKLFVKTAVNYCFRTNFLLRCLRVL